MRENTVLDVRHLRRAFPRPGGGELLVLDDVNLTLHKGEIVGLLGRSGSGKSTLLRLISGLAEPQGGEITYLGQKIDG
ncbi:MAG: ATP-binding cassette domain-containing protein, partial [Alphaproteobacteria bacterium]|nr:ATP-binding cassette domain-containing protein [Alphaproteobacteria bacterium]